MLHTRSFREQICGRKKPVGGAHRHLKWKRIGFVKIIPAWGNIIGDGPNNRISSDEKEAHMTFANANNSLDTFRRIALWFGCLCLSVIFFTLTFSFAGPVMLIVVLRVTMMFALPVWFLYLPFVVSLKDAQPGRLLIFWVSGIIFGPVSLAALGLILQLDGSHRRSIWVGNGIDIGIGPCMICAAIVGFLTTTFYVLATQVIRSRTTNL
jgi:hypothetical protein